ncbi:hypothetical protein HanRHA438_Chr13g0607531 [Helianthus annuus]|nr:hypothetical protein HanRHA438_Chr13g0607531 [Helianthus annuus]
MCSSLNSFLFHPFQTGMGMRLPIPDPNPTHCHPFPVRGSCGQTVSRPFCTL